MTEETRDTPLASHDGKTSSIVQASQSAALCADHAMRDERRPGDYIVDRYLPSASDAMREEARENLRRLIDFIIRVNDRLAADYPQPTIRAPDESKLDSDSPPLPV